MASLKPIIKKTILKTCSLLIIVFYLCFNLRLWVLRLPYERGEDEEDFIGEPLPRLSFGLDSDIQIASEERLRVLPNEIATPFEDEPSMLKDSNILKEVPAPQKSPSCSTTSRSRTRIMQEVEQQVSPRTNTSPQNFRLFLQTSIEDGIETAPCCESETIAPTEASSSPSPDTKVEHLEEEAAQEDGAEKSEKEKEQRALLESQLLLLQRAQKQIWDSKWAASRLKTALWKEKVSSSSRTK